MSETVTIAFSVFGYGKATINLPWQRGKQLREYLRSPTVRKYQLLNQARKNRVFDQSGRKIRLTSRLNPGTVVRVGGAW
jgi:hypothetical protein